MYTIQNPLSLYQVREAVMGTLSAVQLEDLPVVVKFVLHSISASDANEVKVSKLIFFFISDHEHLFSLLTIK